MTQPLLVGLDVGTTASKAVVFTLSGQPLAEGGPPRRGWPRNRGPN